MKRDDDGPIPVLMDAPPAPPPGPAGASPRHAGGLSDDQVIRIHALAAAVRSKPHMDPIDQLKLAARYARWIKNGGDQ